MSTCTLAICEHGAAVIAVGDKVVDTGFARGELRISKVHIVDKRWLLGSVGDNSGAGLQVRDVLRGLLTKQLSSWDAAAVALAGAFTRVRLETAEQSILTPRGITLRSWRDGTAASRQAALQRRIDRELFRFELPATLLLAGFDQQREATLISVRNPGITQRHDALGFHAIGSGARAAYHQMLRRGYHRELPIAEAVFYAVEATMFAVNATHGVQEIDVAILRVGERVKRLSSAAVRQLTELVTRHTRLRVPRGASAHLRRLCSTPE